MNDQQRATMQMALKALECSLSTDFPSHEEIDKTVEAITALREALAQPQGEWVDLTEDEEIEIANSDEAEADNYNSGYSWQDPYVIISLAIAKFKEKNTPPVVPQGEPVAWLRKDHTKTMSNEDKLSWIAAGHTDITDEYTIPLYTTAPSDLGEPIAYLFTDIQSGDTEASCDPYWKTSPYWISEPLYTTPPSVEAAIEAAKVCEECFAEYANNRGLMLVAATRCAIVRAAAEIGKDIK